MASSDARTNEITKAWLEQAHHKTKKHQTKAWLEPMQETTQQQSKEWLEPTQETTTSEDEASKNSID